MNKQQWMHMARVTPIGEALLVLCFVFSVNAYIGNMATKISGDGYGYYDYLISTVFEKDFVRYNKPVQTFPDVYTRIQSGHLTSAYHWVDSSYLVNKYPPGVAVLLSPFFAIGYAISSTDATDTNGFEKPFQDVVFAAALCYLFLGLVFVKRLLRTYHIELITISIIQTAIVFATSITCFAHQDASYSHVYSFFAVAAFLYYSRMYFTMNKLTYLAYASCFLSLVVLLRNINIMVLVFTPFLAENYTAFATSIQRLLFNIRAWLVAAISFLPLIGIQMLCWYLQCGKLFVYSYGNESFDFANPQIMNVLFSYRKGLFVYHPVLSLAFIGIIYWIAHKAYYKAVVWIVFFACFTYVVSSWWIWTYGHSFGQRVYVDFLSILFLPLAFAMHSNRIIRICATLTIVGCIYVNMVQTYQYKQYILHGDGMTKASYWNVFLKTHPKYEGILWIDKGAPFTSITSYSISANQTIPPLHAQVIFDTVVSESVWPKQNGAIRVSFDNPIPERDNSKIALKLTDMVDSNTYVLDGTYLYKFQQIGSDTMQRASFIYRIAKLPSHSPPFRLQVSVFSDEFEVVLKNVQVEIIHTH